MNLPYHLAATLAGSMPLPPGKLARARDAWKAAADGWVHWARYHRTEAPLLWMHAASVGESLVLEPVVRRLRARYGNLQIIQTYSSPSMADWPPPAGVDRADYQPAERASATFRVFNALRPSELVVSRGDLWPQMIHAAVQREIPVVVAGATVRPTSRRLHWPIRSMLRPLLRRLAWMGAVSSDDAHRWIRMGVPAPVIHVTGDPRHDQILERISDPGVMRVLCKWAWGRQVLVAGSTHRRDETVLLDALCRVIARHPEARMIVAPHKPDATAASAVVHGAQSRGLSAGLWKNADTADDVTVLVATKPGVLADLYAVAKLAYVGGGFGSRGVHSIAEPASLAVPVLTGPEAQRDAMARPFLDTGGAVALGTGEPVHDLADRWIGWLEDAGARTAVGLAARRQVRAGAAEAATQAILHFLDRT